MSRSMSLDVLVRLKDKLSGPLRGLRNQLKSLGDFARKIGMLGAAIAAISFMGPIKEAAAFQQKLLDIAGTVDLSGKAAFKFVDEARAKYEALALASGQASDIIAAGAGKMTAAGLDRGLIDASIGNIARAATAANAEFSDMADVATSLIQTLDVKPSGLNDALGALVTSGKLGAFELKDMAKYFPTLTSQMAKFGVKGREAVNELASLLQIARKGTSDPAEAANNLKNFLSKISNPLTKKNFKDAGVDIEAVMKDAAIKGISPVEAVLQKISTLTKASGVDIGKMMAKAKANGLEGADALQNVREQLEKIHGAGALGELFADQQVMDFLIPFMSNIDEYKRIKTEVAKATGAIIDTDFQTQMDGLNRQLGIFTEIGTQGAREVGFAFGSWLPMINSYLMDGLKSYREWNKETGGLGTRLLTMAGGGVLLATALGALGIALPVIGAGLAAVGALLSPLGVLIGALALGAMHIYKNWASYAPRLARLWDSAKRGFFDFVDGVKSAGRTLMAIGQRIFDRMAPTLSRLWDGATSGLSAFADRFAEVTPRLVNAAKEIFDRFGPRIAAGFDAALTDIKAGLETLKGFFEEIAKAADITFDMSGFTVDGAKVAIIQTLEVAMTRLAAAWETLRGFGSGFALHLPDMGKDIGATIKAFKDIGDAIGRMSTSLGEISSVDMSGFSKWLGYMTGGNVATALGYIRSMAEALAKLVTGISALAEKLNVKINWLALMPGNLVAALTNLANAMEAVRKAGEWFNKGGAPIQGIADIQALDDANRAAASNSSLIKRNTTDTLPGKTKDDISSAYPGFDYGGKGANRSVSNDNRGLAAARPAVAQKVDVGGTVVIKVVGPGQVTSTTSTNKSVPISAGTGKRLGRV